MIKRLNIGSRILLYIYFSLMIVYGVFSWRYSIARQDSPVLLYLKFMLIPVGFFIILSKGSFVVNNLRVLGSVIIIAVYFLFDLIIKSANIYQSECLIWCFSFMVGYLLSHYTPHRDKGFSFWPFAFLLFPVGVFDMLMHRGDFSYEDTMMIGEKWIDNNVVMILFSLLPFVLMRKSNRYSDLAIVLVLICAIISVKRTIIVVAFLVGLIYLFYRFRNRGNIVIKLIALVVAFVALFFLVRYIDASLNGGELFARFQNTIQEEDSSGREDQYVVYYNLITNTSLFYQFFGTHETNDFITGYAHNDLLYMAYHYGYVGLALFLIALIKIIVTVIKIVRTNCLGKEMSLACLAALVTLSICGMLNCFVISDGYIYLMLFFGFMIGKYQFVQSNITKRIKNKN